MIWLSYMLNLKESETDNITCFYSTYVYYCDKYKTKINGFTDYDDYMGLIDTRMGVLNMDSNIASKFYKAFKLLCEMYTEFDENTSNCANCSEKAKEFVKIHKELNDPNNISYSGYCQAFSTLSNDYKNLKNTYTNYDFLPEIETTETDAKCSEETSKKNNVAGYEQFSEDTSSNNNLCKIVLYIHMIKHILNAPPNKIIYLTTIKVYICGKFDFLRTYLPDDLSVNGTLELKDHDNFKKYCPITDSGKNECDNDLGKITAGFLWLLEECYSAFKKKTHDENSINAFFMHMISWFSYKLKQKSVSESTKIYDYYSKHVIDSGKYNEFISAAYTISDLKEFMDKRNDLLNINIEDMSKFYDAFNLLCIMYDKVAQNKKDDKLLNDAKYFVKKYQELNGYSNNADDSSYRQILSSLSTNYDDLKTKCKNDLTLPEITEFFSLASTSGFTSLSSSTGNKLFTVLSIFGAIAFFLGISYKYSLFGFRKRAQKQYLKEKIKNIKKKMNR
ncbi:hypothetical protein YYC_02125 [Plasmodium yoelii 17X]|uniref:Uncharacterized protein n=1 Tax=Plasmodium yoelii 17X TaxID=1323249 RepID=V7PQ17_PLAYE|nr:hypothetical protein YYC_02125 [Plasmodium yoelii 17X]